MKRTKQLLSLLLALVLALSLVSPALAAETDDASGVTADTLTTHAFDAGMGKAGDYGLTIVIAGVIICFMGVSIRTDLHKRIRCHGRRSQLAIVHIRADKGIHIFCVIRRFAVRTGTLCGYAGRKKAQDHCQYERHTDKAFKF